MFLPLNIQAPFFGCRTSDFCKAKENAKPPGSARPFLGLEYSALRRPLLFVPLMLGRGSLPFCPVNVYFEDRGSLTSERPSLRCGSYRAYLSGAVAGAVITARRYRLAFFGSRPPMHEVLICMEFSEVHIHDPA